QEPLLPTPSDSISEFILMDPHCPRLPGLMSSLGPAPGAHTASLLPLRLPEPVPTASL
ncbi:unnamed protein product, partial [Rangifer tarandus platyrhynchus]